MTTNDRLVCWKCGAPIECDGPFARLEACRQCGAELHACVMCTLYEPRRTNACQEERAEPPPIKDRANFCDYFSPRPGAFLGASTSTEAAARAQLAALFGEAGASPAPNAEMDDAQRALEALFEPKDKP